MKLKKFIPPILLPFFRFKKEYKSYELANSVAQNGAYENALLCEVVAKKTVAYRDSNSSSPHTLSATNIFLMAAISTYLNHSKKRSINVVDFGGACGIHYFDIKKLLGAEINLDWTVVETTGMVNAAQKQQLNNDSLRFVDNIDDIVSEMEFIYSSCALLYVPDPYQMLQKLIDKKATWILLNRMMFNEDDRDIFTLQKSLLSKNGPGHLPNKIADKIIYYPHTTLSYKKFLKQMEKDYTLEWIYDENSGIFPINAKKIVGKGLLFKRKL